MYVLSFVKLGCFLRLKISLEFHLTSEKVLPALCSNSKGKKWKEEEEKEERVSHVHFLGKVIASKRPIRQRIQRSGNVLAECSLLFLIIQRERRRVKLLSDGEASFLRGERKRGTAGLCTA